MTAPARSIFLFTLLAVMFMSGFIVASALRTEEPDLGRRQLLDAMTIAQTSKGDTINKGNTRVESGFTAKQSTARIAGVTMYKGGTLSQDGSNLRKRSHSATKSARLS